LGAVHPSRDRLRAFSFLTVSASPSHRLLTLPPYRAEQKSYHMHMLPIINTGIEWFVTLVSAGVHSQYLTLSNCSSHQNE
jgi:hypothetical protein